MYKTLVNSHQALRRAVAIAKTQTAFSAATGISQQRLSYILKKGNDLPAEYVLAAEAAFGVSRHALRPDIYPIHEVSAGDGVVSAAPLVACKTTATMQDGRR